MTVELRRAEKRKQLQSGTCTQTPILGYLLSNFKCFAKTRLGQMLIYRNWRNKEETADWRNLGRILQKTTHVDIYYKYDVKYDSGLVLCKTFCLRQPSAVLVTSD